MTPSSAQAADYDVVFDQVRSGSDIEGADVLDVAATAQLSNEIEALRSIVEDVESATSAQHSITLG